MILKLTPKQAHMLIQQGCLKDHTMTMNGKSFNILSKYVKSLKRT